MSKRRRGAADRAAGVVRLVRAGGVAAVTAVVADRLLEGPAAARRLPGWTRPNYRAATVSLSGGAAAALGSVVGAAAGSGPYRLPALLAGTSAAVAGAYDDLVAARFEQRGDKGWRGHVGAARSGRLSGGAVKVVIIGAGALAAAYPAAAVARAAGATSTRAAGAMLRDAALIAGTANLLNLLDLRPGRAGKVALAGALLTCGGAGGPAAAAVAGAAAATLPADLAERRMLGDLGANTLGAVLGVRLAAGRPSVGSAALATVVALTAASERISFSAVIDSVPALRAVDRWGRRRADADAASLR